MSKIFKSIQQRLFDFNTRDKEFSKLKFRSAESFSLMQINTLFQDKPFYFPHNHFSLAPSAIAHILNEIIIRGCRNIIEFGSGLSTYYIAQLIHIQKLECNFYSVENDNNWIHILKSQMDGLGTGQYVSFIYAPFCQTDKCNLSENQVWYNTKVLDKEIKADKMDMVIIDGPGGATSKFARYPAIPYLLPRIHENTSVFLDDIHRNDEYKILNEWQKLLNKKYRIFNRYAYYGNAGDFRTNSFIFKH